MKFKDFFSLLVKENEFEANLIDYMRDKETENKKNKYLTYIIVIIDVAYEYYYTE